MALCKRRSLRVVLGAAALVAAAAATASLWARLQDDGVHDPRSPAMAQLQQPAEALAPLPRDTAGNQVNWVQALDSGAIAPRSTLLDSAPVRTRDDSFLISRFGSMPAVRFPHRQHTLWLDCANCHEALFKSQRGANRYSMSAILEGEQCGVCHGAVAFPLTECNRCHSVSNAQLLRELRGQPR
ncbi:MAG: hypothetical protein JNL30_17290 [Rubrivivax sp.]|nr:hypothetical protein [Rubrivivax sp.]